MLTAFPPHCPLHSFMHPPPPCFPGLWVLIASAFLLFFSSSEFSPLLFLPSLCLPLASCFPSGPFAAKRKMWKLKTFGSLRNIYKTGNERRWQVPWRLLHVVVLTLWRVACIDVCPQSISPVIEMASITFWFFLTTHQPWRGGGGVCIEGWASRILLWQWFSSCVTTTWNSGASH